MKKVTFPLQRQLELAVDILVNHMVRNEWGVEVPFVFVVSQELLSYKITAFYDPCEHTVDLGSPWEKESRMPRFSEPFPFDGTDEDLSKVLDRMVEVLSKQKIAA